MPQHGKLEVSSPSQWANVVHSSGILISDHCPHLIFKPILKFRCSYVSVKLKNNWVALADWSLLWPFHNVKSQGPLAVNQMVAKQTAMPFDLHVLLDDWSKKNVVCIWLALSFMITSKMVALWAYTGSCLRPLRHLWHKNISEQTCQLLLHLILILTNYLYIL